MNFYINNLEGVQVATLSNDAVGAHSDILEAYIEEKLSTYDQLFLTIPAGKDFEESSLINEGYAIVFKDTKGWREYIISVIEETDNGLPTKYIQADLSSIELEDEIIETELYGETVSAKTSLERILEGTEWEVGTVDSSIYTQRFSENTEYVSVLEALDLLSSNYTCEVQFSYSVSAGEITGRYVNLYRKFGRDEGKRFEMGVDVDEIKRTVDSSAIKTAIIPMGKMPEEVTETDEETGEETTYTPERIDIKGIEWSVENGDPVDKPKGQNWLGNPAALENFGRTDEHGNKKHKKLFQEIEVDTDEALINMGWVQLGRYVNPKVTYETKIHDIYILSGYDDAFKHQHVFLGDTVVVLDRNFNKPIEVETRVVEMKRDLLNPIANDITLGESRTLFSNKETQDRVDNLEKQVNDGFREVYQNLTTVQEGAGGFSIYRGSVNPVGMSVNDLWFRPNPTEPQYTQMVLWNGTTWDVVGDDADLADASRLQFGILDGALLNVINLNANSITGGTLDLSTGLSIKAGNLEVLKVDTETGAVELNATSIRMHTMSLEEYIKLQSPTNYEVRILGNTHFKESKGITANTYEAVLYINGVISNLVEGKPLSYVWTFVDPLTQEKVGDWERTGKVVEILRDDLPKQGIGATSTLVVDIYTY